MSKSIFGKGTSMPNTFDWFNEDALQDRLDYNRFSFFEGTPPTKIFTTNESVRALKDLSFNSWQGTENLIDEDEVPFSLSHPQSLVSMARDSWDYSPDLDTADRVLADTFIFADSPTVQKVAVRLGYDAFVYKDVFAGGKDATKELLGMDVASVPGIEMEYDLHTNNDRSRRVPVHRTFRPLTAEAVIDIATLPTVEVIQKGLII